MKPSLPPALARPQPTAMLLLLAGLLLGAPCTGFQTGGPETISDWRTFLAQDATEVSAATRPASAAAAGAVFPRRMSRVRQLQRSEEAAPSKVEANAMGILPEPPNVAHGLLLLSRAQVKWDTECPQWIQEYAALHAQATHTNTAGATPQLMMHECNEHTLAGCPGLGDRFRGLMETFKFAVHSGRLFLLRWESSAPLEDVLQPALIDWRVQPKYNVDTIKDTSRYYWHKPLPKAEAIVSGAFVNDTNHLISLTHADQDCRHQLPGPDIGCTHSVPSILRSCVFHALFKPSKSLAAFVADTRKRLFGSAKERYLAVHLRIGGFEGERKVVRGGLSAGNQSTAEAVASALSAARDLAAASNISAPILVLTDNDELREQLQRGLIPGFVSPAYKAKHAAMARGEQHKEALLTSVADLMLLAQASCFIGSSSGFTYTAFLWGRHDCFLIVHDKQRGVTIP